MTEDAAAKDALTKSDFFWGFFAALRLVHGTTVRAKPSELHRAFHRVFSKSTLPAFKKLAEDTGYCYDPLYGQSAWLAIGITQASRDLIVELPLAVGRWNDIDIRFTRKEAERRLGDLGFRDEFISLANDFIRNLRNEARPTDGQFFECFMAAVYASGGKFWAAPRDQLLPAFRRALEASGFPYPGSHPAGAVSDEYVAHWLKSGLARLRGIELVESNSNVLIHDYRIRMTPETAEATLSTSMMKDEFIALGKAFLDYLAALPSPFGARWGAKPGWSADTDPR